MNIMKRMALLLARRLVDGRTRASNGHGVGSTWPSQLARRRSELVDEPQQVQGAERLGEEEGGARRSRARLVLLRAGRGQHHDGGLRRAVVLGADEAAR